MACFLVSAAEAVVVKVIEKGVESREEHESSGESTKEVVSIPFSTKLKWLGNMLWGGAALLMFEHIWHGEVTPWFPFLTAMSDPGDAAEMFHEMSTVGVCMAVLVTAVWAVMCVAADTLKKRSSKAAPQESEV